MFPKDMKLENFKCQWWLLTAGRQVFSCKRALTCSLTPEMPHDSHLTLDLRKITPHPGSQKTVHVRSGQQVTKMKSRVREQSRILCQTIGWMNSEDVRNKTTKQMVMKSRPTATLAYVAAFVTMKWHVILSPKTHSFSTYNILFKHKQK